MASALKALFLVVSLLCLTSWHKVDTDAKQNIASFEKELSPCCRALFTRLSPDKQEKAMNYADEMALSPDDAVVRVSCECKKITSR